MQPTRAQSAFLGIRMRPSDRRNHYARILVFAQKSPRRGWVMFPPNGKSKFRLASLLIDHESSSSDSAGDSAIYRVLVLGPRQRPRHRVNPLPDQRVHDDTATSSQARRLHLRQMAADLTGDADAWANHCHSPVNHWDGISSITIMEGSCSFVQPILQRGVRESGLPCIDHT